jgi:hypothetical protein
LRDIPLGLFDEPLSNLDAKLRVQTRAEIRKPQRRLGIRHQSCADPSVGSQPLVELIRVKPALGS